MIHTDEKDEDAMMTSDENGDAGDAAATTAR